MAQRLLKKHEDDVDALITECFELSTSRLPDKEELEILRAMLQEQKDHFTQHPAQAEEFLNVGETNKDESIDPAELAAASVLAKALLKS